MALSSEVRARINAIRSDRASGARDLVARAAEALSLAPEAVAEAAREIIAAQPMMAPMYNLARAAAAAADVAAACGEFVATLDRHARIACAHAARLVPQGAAVLVHSRSSALEAALVEARSAGRVFDVIATESRPGREGVALAERLASLGIRVRVIVDAAVFLYAPRCGLGLCGADAVTPSGVVNKIGTQALVRACRAAGTPVYAVCTSEKFLPEGAVLPPEPPKEPLEVLERVLPGVEAENYYFETTPRELFTGLITEDGAG